MINQYIQAAIKLAKYEILEDNNSIYAEIPGLEGVYAKGNSFEECRMELIEIVEEWVIIRLRKNLHTPPLENIDLNIMETIDAAC